MLSRFCLPYRRLSDAEIAQKISEYIEGTDVTIPFNVVWPGLRDALIDIGVTISEPAGANENSLAKYNVAYQAWLNGENQTEKQNDMMEPVTDKQGQLGFEDYGIRYSRASDSNSQDETKGLRDQIRSHSE